MQNFAGRILTNTTPVLHERAWLTIEEILRFRDVTMIVKCLSGLVPAYLNTKLVKRSLVLHYRQSNQLNLSQCRTSAAQRAFRFKASKYWHSLY